MEAQYKRMAKELHDMLTDPDNILHEQPLGRLYCLQLARARQLRARLQEVDPDWLERWERGEVGR